MTEAGCKIKFHTLQESENFCVTSRILDDLYSTDIFFLCNPNNPTWSLISHEIMEKISQYCIKKNILIVANECFLEFTGKYKEYSMPMNKNAVTLKAFTKLYAMVGLRLRYMLFVEVEFAEKVLNTG